MKRFSSLFILLFLTASNFTFGQTGERQIIAGTKCSMIPPAGFKTAINFSGFEKQEVGAIIMITEMPAPFSKISAGFTSEALLEQGITLINKEVIDFNGSEGILMNVSQSANAMVYMKELLVFGDSLKTILVNGMYPESQKEIANEINTALMSTVYDPNQKENGLEAVKFSVDVSQSEFKYAKYTSGTLLYTPDGLLPTKSTENPMLLVSGSISGVNVFDKKEYSVSRLKKLPHGETTVVSTVDSITINGIGGFEIVANGKNTNDHNQLIYFVMLFSDTNEYFIITGSATGNYEHYLPVFRSIANTFKLNE
ncbi:MAG: hypothetical protein ACHQFW_04215 [Chitinophagales bacterium]